MIKKIREMLSSYDKEIVELGATLLSDQVPQQFWDLILSDCIDKKFTYYIDVDNNIVIFENDWWGSNLRNYKIQTGRGGMEMMEEAMKGMYQQLPTTPYQASYNITNFSLDTLTEAIKSFYEGKDNGNA